MGNEFATCDKSDWEVWKISQSLLRFSPGGRAAHENSSGETGNDSISQRHPVDG
jgi:hypothetical protein